MRQTRHAFWSLNGLLSIQIVHKNPILTVALRVAENCNLLENQAVTTKSDNFKESVNFDLYHHWLIANPPTEKSTLPEAEPLAEPRRLVFPIETFQKRLIARFKTIRLFFPVWFKKHARSLVQSKNRHDYRPHLPLRCFPKKLGLYDRENFSLS